MTDIANNCLISLNPANGSALGFVETTTDELISASVSRSRQAQQGWRNISPEQRSKMVMQGAAAMIDHEEELGTLLSCETGKPRRAGQREIRSVASAVESRSQDVVKAIETQCHVGHQVESSIYYDPLGVCAVITPADHPVAMAHRMMIPALVAGNSVVLKPSPDTPLVCQKMVELYQHFLPEGVLQLVHGGDAQGRSLVAANVQLIAFTGSTKAGKHIMNSAAFALKRLVLALGGKDVLIVLADADLDAAAKFAVESSLGNAGQTCVSTERILVDHSVAASFEQKIADLASEYRIGSWDDPNTDIGPMINTQRRERVIGQIEDALRKGARSLCGGRQHPEFFIRPTVLSQVNREMRILHEETLGPVLCTSHFGDIDEAVRMANQSSYALGAVIFGDEARAEKLARRLDAGMIGINKSLFGVGDLPWVGAKYSGFGYHGSPDGYRQFTQPRVLSRQLTQTEPD